MKFLSDYTQDAQTKLFNETGAFFAFGNQQFLESRIEGVKYVHAGGGLYCPKQNFDQLDKGLDIIQQAGINQDIEENGIDNIIKRELFNYESFYTGDYSNALETLKQYNITEEKVSEMFYQILPTVD